MGHQDVTFRLRDHGRSLFFFFLGIYSKVLMTIAQAPLKASILSQVSVSVTMSISVSTAIVSQTMTIVSQMVSISQTGVSVSVVRISLSFSLSLPLVQSGHLLEGAGSTRVKLADSISGASYNSYYRYYRTKVSVSDEVRFSLSTPLTKGMDNRIGTASIASGLESVSTDGRPGWYTGLRISLGGGQGGYSQARGNQELVHDVTTHWSTEL